MWIYHRIISVYIQRVVSWSEFKKVLGVKSNQVQISSLLVKQKKPSKILKDKCKKQLKESVQIKSDEIVYNVCQKVNITLSKFKSCSGVLTDLRGRNTILIKLYHKYSEITVKDKYTVTVLGDMSQNNSKYFNGMFILITKQLVCDALSGLFQKIHSNTKQNIQRICLKFKN